MSQHKERRQLMETPARISSLGIRVLKIQLVSLIKVRINNVSLGIAILNF